MIRRLITALARTANWCCTHCGTWNGDDDKTCLVCG